IAIAAMPPRSPTRSRVGPSSSETQSHSTLPAGVRTSRARCPIPNDGVTPRPTRPGSSSRTSLAWSRASSGMVVHCWPSQPTYCRSSEQIGEPGGGCSVSAYCTPHVAQIQAVIDCSLPTRCEDRCTHRHGKPNPGPLCTPSSSPIVVRTGFLLRNSPAPDLDPPLPSAPIETLPPRSCPPCVLKPLRRDLPASQPRCPTASHNRGLLMGNICGRLTCAERPAADSWESTPCRHRDGRLLASIGVGAVQGGRLNEGTGHRAVAQCVVGVEVEIALGRVGKNAEPQPVRVTGASTWDAHCDHVVGVVDRVLHRASHELILAAVELGDTGRVIGSCVQRQPPASTFVGHHLYGEPVAAVDASDRLQLGIVDLHPDPGGAVGQCRLYDVA